jgi:hypothetical protein
VYLIRRSPVFGEKERPKLDVRSKLRKPESVRHRFSEHAPSELPYRVARRLFFQRSRRPIAAALRRPTNQSSSISNASGQPSNSDLAVGCVTRCALTWPIFRVRPRVPPCKVSSWRHLDEVTGSTIEFVRKAEQTGIVQRIASNWKDSGIEHEIRRLRSDAGILCSGKS